jgi:S1-C subfamily serine protease
MPGFVQFLTDIYLLTGLTWFNVFGKAPSPRAESSLELEPIHAGQILDAKVLGIHKQSDLALLKVEAMHLPSHFSDGHSKSFHPEQVMT